MKAHRITDEYARNRDRLTVSYPSAHAFLCRLEREGPRFDLWLSTAVNAHLYKQNAFLAYLRLKHPESKPPSLLLSPNFNQQIASHTTDQASRLFPSVTGLLKSHRAHRDGWVIPRASGVFELLAQAPAAFFDDLFDEVATLPLE